MTDKITHSRK